MVLSRKQEKLHNVDWLTEALRRFTQAHLLNRGWSTVDMSVIPTRPEKVMSQTKISGFFLVRQSDWFDSGRRAKRGIPTGNGPQRRSLLLRMAFTSTALNFELYMTKSVPVPWPRLCGFTGTGKSGCGYSSIFYLIFSSSVQLETKGRECANQSSETQGQRGGQR